MNNRSSKRARKDSSCNAETNLATWGFSNGCTNQTHCNDDETAQGYIDFSSINYWPNDISIEESLDLTQPFYFGQDLEAPQPPVNSLKRRRVGEEDDLESQKLGEVEEVQRADINSSGATTHVSVAEARSSLSPTNQSLGEFLPELFAQVPLLKNRKVAEILPNPFKNGSTTQIIARYDVSKRAPSVVPANGQINGYVKFQFRPGNTAERNLNEGLAWSNTPQPERDMHHSGNSSWPSSVSRPIPPAPSNFGVATNLDALDRQLLCFYEVAFCPGRTLLPNGNVYLDIMAMTDANDGVRHCALALAAGYLLDYAPSETQLWSRANFHYGKAVELLGDSLGDPSITEVGKEDSTVGSLILLFSDDIVNWELQAPKNRDPRWRQASRTAKKILDSSDPGYRYWNSENVQSSRIRAANANMVAYTEICALPVTPLEIESSDKLYAWLLEGSEKEVHQIHGATGVSPKLLHIYAQITQLSARLEKTPDSIILPLAADEVENRLKNFRQWSEISQGHDSAKLLLASCILDEQGLVYDAPTVTDLTGETWVQAAKIYLQCRFHRLPRYHAKVQTCLRLLLHCVERMPTSGPLFTAQSPFFCIFLAGLVAYEDSDRQVLRDWFESVVTSASPRSSVPPVWRVLRQFWTWIDQEYPVTTDTIGRRLSTTISEREPWWERMVSRFMDTEGQLSLV